LPDVPTLRRDGIERLRCGSPECAVRAARNARADRYEVERSDEANSALPEIKRWFEESGLEVPMSSPEELTAFMKADIEKWVQVAKHNNLKIEMQ
jgi:tripartite-type tricarboxylate transporter receptor subunit TctC